MIRNIARTLLFSASIGGLSGCANLEIETTARPALQQEVAGIEAPDRWTFGKEIDLQVANDWTTIVQDARLSKLIEKALERNPTLRASAESVARARAVLAQSQAAFLPTINGQFNASGTGALEGDDFNDSYSSAVTANWEADLWGAIRSGVLNQRYDLQSTEAVYKSTREALIANVARAYITLVEAQKQLDLAEETLAAQIETLRVVQTRYDLGAASRREVVLAESDVASARDNVAVTSATRISSAIALQILIGDYPDGSIEIEEEFPLVQKDIGIGTQIDLLSRRPDILAAEYDVLSAFAATRVLEARRWPTLSLSTGISTGASTPSNLFDPTSIAYSIGLSLANSLFDGGLSRNQIEAATATQHQALAIYGQTVLAGFQDVEITLQNLQALDQRLIFTEQRVIAARETLELAEIQYRAGDIELLDVLTFRQRSFQADSTLLNIQQQLLDTRIALYLALGGAA